uniref:Phosphoglycerate kinase n=1 Tax=Biomphalaria glabrata TaxID=6526 RepID=A0A2C9JQE8_BIOGL
DKKLKKLRIDQMDLRGKRVLIRLDLDVPTCEGVVLDTDKLEEALPTIRWMCQVDVSSVCVKWMCQVDVSGRCVKWMCQVDASGRCVRWMCQVDVSSGCVRWMCQVDVSSGCVRWMCEVDVSGGCVKWMCQVDVSDRCVRWMCQVDVSGGCVKWMCQVDAATFLSISPALMSSIQTVTNNGSTSVALGMDTGVCLGQLNALDTFTLIKKAKVCGIPIHLPVDLVVAESLLPPPPPEVTEEEVTEAPVSDLPKTEVVTTSQGVPQTSMVCDIGPDTIQEFQQLISNAKTIIYIGDAGAYDYEPFSQGTK